MLFYIKGLTLVEVVVEPQLKRSHKVKGGLLVAFGSLILYLGKES